MTFSGFLFLLLLTGGSSYNHTEPPDGEYFFNQSHLNRGSSYIYTGFLGDQFSGDGGSGDGITKLPDSGRVKNQDWSQNTSQMVHPCSYINLINHFNLSDKVKFYQSRPTKRFFVSTEVKLFIYLYSILDVKEKEQELVAYFWINVYWRNKFLKWNAEEFCNITFVTLPSELLWKPDLTIEEVTIKDKLFQIPYLTAEHVGKLYQRHGLVLVSTCKMRFYRFPFDSQTCSLTFKSIQHKSSEINIISGRTSEDFLKKSRRWMQTESEWILMNISVDVKDDYKFGYNSSMLVYTTTIKRRSVLYVANFIVPILFFLCLDLASFLISESGGEKLSFKVTVLLAVTVMQLILNDILPSSSDRIPLIAVYCIGSFILMMLSLLETILMMYLMEKDDVTKDKEADKDQNLCDSCMDQGGKVQKSFRDTNKSISRVRIFDEPPAETLPELLPEVKEVSSGQLTVELMEVLKAVTQLLRSRKEDNEPGYWTRMTKKLNRIYFVFYMTTAIVFLSYVFSIWLS